MAQWTSYESPQQRRLRSDAAALARLVEESSVLRVHSSGEPPDRYTIEFAGRSLARDDERRIVVRERHQVAIKLGASYPRTMPEIRWLTPIYHPNISEVGLVCLGGYGTHWVPSLHLDALLGMLWDMARYQNYDIRSPYNREAALWAAQQSTFKFPLDARPLRDRRIAQGRIETPAPAPARPLTPAPMPAIEPEPRPAAPPATEPSESILVINMEFDLRRPAPVRPAAPVRPTPPADEVVFLD